MNILAFESSCDETAVAVVRDGRTVLSDAILSQADMHALYGGVVPEIASRKHVEAIAGLTDQALSDAGLTKSDVDAVAVTYAPRPHRRRAGGGQLRQVRGLCAGRAADPGPPRPRPHRRQLSGLPGAGAALSGAGHLRRQHPHRGCPGLYGHGDLGSHTGRRCRRVLRQGGPCAGPALPRRQAHGRSGPAVPPAASIPCLVSMWRERSWI